MSDEVTEFAHAGLDCLVIKQHMFGYLEDYYCGYVRVGEEHPWYLKDHFLDEADLVAHIDITFSGPDPRVTDRENPGCRKGSRWWLGFYVDAAQSFEYVVETTKRLAEWAFHAAVVQEVLQ